MHAQLWPTPTTNGCDGQASCLMKHVHEQGRDESGRQEHRLDLTRDHRRGDGDDSRHVAVVIEGEEETTAKLAAAIVTHLLQLESDAQVTRPHPRRRGASGFAMSAGPTRPHRIDLQGVGLLGPSCRRNEKAFCIH